MGTKNSIKKAVIIVTISIIGFGCKESRELPSPTKPITQLEETSQSTPVPNNTIADGPEHDINWYKNGVFTVKNNSGRTQTYIACSFRVPEQTLIDTKIGTTASGDTFSEQLALDSLCSQTDIIQPPSNCRDYGNIIHPASYYQQKFPTKSLDFSLCFPIPTPTPTPKPPCNGWNCK